VKGQASPHLSLGPRWMGMPTVAEIVKLYPICPFPTVFAPPWPWYIFPVGASQGSSVADPGCFIPDPTIAPSRIRIRPLLHPGSRIRGVKKHRIPDPQHCRGGLNNVQKWRLTFISGVVWSKGRHTQIWNFQNANEVCKIVTEIKNYRNYFLKVQFATKVSLHFLNQQKKIRICWYS
jgi:hypothetical protein